MIITTLPTKQAVSYIVRTYRDIVGENGRTQSLRDFAKNLTKILQPLGGSISHQTIKNWEDGTHLPATFYLMQIAFHAPHDWRQDFAQDLIAALHPDLYKPATLIGKQAIKQYKPQPQTSPHNFPRPSA